jgi:hypothetical protein
LIRSAGEIFWPSITNSFAVADTVKALSGAVARIETTLLDADQL